MVKLYASQRRLGCFPPLYPAAGVAQERGDAGAPFDLAYPI